MKKIKLLISLLSILMITVFFTKKTAPQNEWIRINWLGYKPGGVKVAVWCSKENKSIKNFKLIDAVSKKTVFSSNAGKQFGPYGPFTQTYRLNFSEFKKPGSYYLLAGNARSPEFSIDKDVYKGTADFCLRYMRQQRSGFNPFLKDSCHTHDGYTLYGPMPDSTHLDVVGGWHDASDYLQYSTTSANATWHLLAAYRDFPNVFSDEKQANGLDGKNGLPDVCDEAVWGLDWLLKMFPRNDWMFNQIADDRDHMGMRIPKEDSFYARGYERPVYFITGEPQQRGRFMNNSTGTSSTAAKFASAFALADYLCKTDSVFKKNSKRKSYYDKALEAYGYALKKPGVTQTASVRSPYIYAEDNWTDDMELAAASLHEMIIHTPSGSDNGSYMLQALEYAEKEKITPWLGADTASHYQWYPFINLGHYELIKQLKSKQNGPVTGYSKQFLKELWYNADTIVKYYKTGIERVWNKAKQNAFYRGVPFIWCSNNLTTSLTIQCYWYRELTGDKTFSEFEQANFDWLFGCNPWGTSMVFGLPAWADTPVDPHSALTHLKNYPIDGGLVDGPVYGNIYKNLIGITLYQQDEYAEFQSDLVVYHDDYGDYSTNEPTMDGTASLVYLLAAKESDNFSKTTPLEKILNTSKKKVTNNLSIQKDKLTLSHGGIIRGDSTQKKLALVFTGDEFADGASFIAQVLQKEKVKASFFLTGKFYRNPLFKENLIQLKTDGHYLGPHSDKHLLYCDWNNRDSLLVTKEEFSTDLKHNYSSMAEFGVSKNNALFFMPPFEWYNDSITSWTNDLGLQLINYTPGTLSHTDYTTPDMTNYRNSDIIYKSIIDHQKTTVSGFSGYILLMHIGTDPARVDKFYLFLPRLINWFKTNHYQLVRIDQLLD